MFESEFAEPENERLAKTKIYCYAFYQGLLKDNSIRLRLLFRKIFVTGRRSACMILCTFEFDFLILEFPSDTNDQEDRSKFMIRPHLDSWVSLELMASTANPNFRKQICIAPRGRDISVEDETGTPIEALLMPHVKVISLQIVI